MPGVWIFLIGVAVGYIARRYAFCIFGSVVELMKFGTWRRMSAVASAMLVFGLVQMGRYQHAAEYPGLQYLVGGWLQGVGYYLAVGCPLSLLVRIGEGSKFHVVVFASFLVGVALYTGLLAGPVATLLEPIRAHRVMTLLDLVD